MYRRRSRFWSVVNVRRRTPFNYGKRNRYLCPCTRNDGGGAVLPGIFSRMPLIKRGELLVEKFPVEIQFGRPIGLDYRL